VLLAAGRATLEVRAQSRHSPIRIGTGELQLDVAVERREALVAADLRLKLVAAQVRQRRPPTCDLEPRRAKEQSVEASDRMVTVRTLAAKRAQPLARFHIDGDDRRRDRGFHDLQRTRGERAHIYFVNRRACSLRKEVIALDTKDPA
jgi:hypothetical protein